MDMVSRSVKEIPKVFPHYKYTKIKQKIKMRIVNAREANSRIN